MNKRVLIMMIGVPGSGKTTIAERITKEYNIPVVSSDKIREELYGKEEIQGRSQEVFEKVYEHVNFFLECYGVCILDATNVVKKNRINAILKTLPDEIVYILADEDLNLAKERNHSRERVVPNEVIDRMNRQLQKNYPHEGEIKNLYIFHYNDEALEDYLEELLW